MEMIFTDDRIAEIADMLTQYAPEGWLKLNLKAKTDSSHTEVTTWAETKNTAHFGFDLDDEDRARIDEIIDDAWESSVREWSGFDFSVTSDGEFDLSVQY